MVRRSQFYFLTKCTLKYIRNITYKILYRLFWLSFPKQIMSPGFQGTVHFLVVGNSVYARIVQTAIESFLFFNPRARVLIHCDPRTERAVKRSLFLVRLRHPKKVAISVTGNDEIWYKQKLQLILSLVGTTDMFLDADVRIRGPIHSTSKITFLVRENKVASTLDFGLFDLLKNEILSGEISFSTKNTTAFSWGGLILAPNQIQLAWEIYQSVVRKLFSSPELRLSEQITLSILVDALDLEVSYLKESDSQFDGSAIESSYFGATSSKFF